MVIKPYLILCTGTESAIAPTYLSKLTVTMRTQYSFLGGILSFLYLPDGIDSLASTFHPTSKSLCVTHQQLRMPYHAMHEFSTYPYSRGLRRRESTSPTSSSSALALSTSSTISSLKSSNSFILSALLIVSSCGLAIEKKTTVGKALSVSFSNVNTLISR